MTLVDDVFQPANGDDAGVREKFFTPCSIIGWRVTESSGDSIPHVGYV